MLKSLATILLTTLSFICSYSQSRDKQPKNNFDKEKPFEITSSHKGLSSQSSAKDTDMCIGWNIPQSDLIKIIKDCEPIDDHQWHYLFDVLPCVVIGELKQNGEAYKFEINAGSWMYVYCKDSALLLGNFRKENEKYFLSNAWIETVTDTLKINEQQLVQTSVDDKFQSLTTLAGDTIVKYQAGYFKAEYVDIDEDGYTDIRVFVFSNTPNQCENYLFDEQREVYRHVDNSDLDFKLVKGTKYFYSYNSVGCGDMCWESHLFEIADWKEVTIGRIEAKCCVESDEGIYIYKVKDEEQTFLKKIPLVQFDKNGKNNKWNFIKKFWLNNYKEFID